MCLYIYVSNIYIYMHVYAAVDACSSPLEIGQSHLRVNTFTHWVESRSAALGGFSATTTSTIKRRCAVSRSVFV